MGVKGQLTVKFMSYDLMNYDSKLPLLLLLVPLNNVTWFSIGRYVSWVSTMGGSSKNTVLSLELVIL